MSDKGKEPDNAEEPEEEALATTEDAAAADLAAEPEIDLPAGLKDAPPQVRRVFEWMATSFSTGPQAHPLIQKFGPEHIDKFLDYAHEDDRRDHEHRRAGRWFGLFYYVFSVGILLALVWLLLPQHKELLVELIKILVVFAGGFGAGYGIKARRSR